jgi:hypothetical protein
MRIPCCDEIELRDNTMDLRPAYDHPLFQRLGHIKQLGQRHRGSFPAPSIPARNTAWGPWAPPNPSTSSGTTAAISA